MIEKRKHQRIQKKCKSLVESIEGITLSTVHDISEGGVFICTPEPISPGSTVEIELILSNEHSISLKGTVCWVRNHDEENRKAGMGIKFIPTKDEIEQLKKALQ